MTTVSALGKEFAPPGPGAWEIENTHMTRPVTRFVGEIFTRAMPRGFKQSTARYGVLLSHLDTKLVNGFIYTQPVPFGAPPGAKGPPPKPIFWLVTRVHPGIRKRIAASHDAMENRLWRDDLKRWDDEVKPAAIEAHRKLQSVDVDKLDANGIAEHLRECEAHLDRMVEQHHTFNIACMLPVGDFMSHAVEWTGKSPGEILHVLRGASPISRGAAAEQLDALATAINADADAKKAVESGAAASDVLAQLRAHDGAVGKSMRAYEEALGVRSLGFDVSEPHVLEVPELVVKMIRAALDTKAAPVDDADAKKQRIAKLRDAVPDAHKEKFDALLEEARVIYRLRDERGFFSDAWALGLARRAIVAAGKRAAADGHIDAPELLVDASHDEMQSLLKGEKSVSSDELRERASYRKKHSTEDAPKNLGGEAGGPPPVEWLPEKAQRTARAVGAVMGAMFDPAKATGNAKVAGLPVSPGTYEGTARLILSEGEFDRIQKGDVLVTRATAAYFNPVLPLLGALVTDRGGQLSHAAIVAREYGIPGVVGTREATLKIKDGARVRVDGTSGDVEVLG
jgi:pyruvate,water dikinase